MLGMVARADNGGLGAQTWEAWRHLRPARTLIVHTAHKTRGRAHEGRFTALPGVETRFTHREPTANDIAWLVDETDTLFSVETWYGRQLLTEAHHHRTVLLANPEMHDHDLAGDHVYVPTLWRRDLVSGARLLPAPIARDRLPYRQRTAARTLYHVASPAFHDRNGTELTLAAAAQMREPCRLLIRGGDERPGRREQLGVVDVEWLGHHDGPYYEAWPEEADVLVLPRRFGGLCLPIQEAAALGIPVVTLAVAPNLHWPVVQVPAHAEKYVPVKAGQIDIHSCDPRVLADRLDTLVRDPELVAGLSARIGEWGETLEWDRLLPDYEVALRDRVGRGPVPA